MFVSFNGLVGLQGFTNGLRTVFGFLFCIVFFLSYFYWVAMWL